MEFYDEEEVIKELIARSPYSVGDFVKCYYDMSDYYLFPDDERTYYYGVITHVHTYSFPWPKALYYRVICTDGKERYFLMHEIHERHAKDAQ